MSLLIGMGCYTTGDLADREYMGNHYIYELEAATQELACQVFKAKYCDLRPLGGHMAGIACAMAVAAPGETVLEYHLESWGHGFGWPKLRCYSTLWRNPECPVCEAGQ